MPRLPQPAGSLAEGRGPRSRVLEHRHQGRTVAIGQLPRLDPAQRAFCGVHLREGNVDHKKLNPFLGRGSRGRLPQLFGGGRFKTAKFRHRFADDRSVEGGEFVRQVVVYHPVAEIPQRNPCCQAADEPDFLHAK